MIFCQKLWFRIIVDKLGNKISIAPSQRANFTLSLIAVSPLEINVLSGLKMSNRGPIAQLVRAIGS